MGNVIYRPVYPYHNVGFCKTVACSNYEYKCYHEGFCIEIKFVCDDIKHCLFGDDEIDCENFYPKGFFKCKNQS